MYRDIHKTMTTHIKNRRQFLGTALAGIIASSAGCTSDGTGETTSSENGEPPAPDIKEVSLVTEHDSYGDLAQNKISAAASDAIIDIAFNYESTTHDNEHHVTNQVRIFDNSGNRIAQESVDDKQLEGQSGRDTWENSFWFDTEGWGKGEYEIEVLIRDQITGLSSSPGKGKFELTEPLHQSEVGVVEIDAPSSVRVGEDYQITFRIRNTSSRDGTVRTRLSEKYERNNWYTYNDYLDITIAAGSVREWTSSTFSFNQSGEYEFRLDSINESWNVTVEDR